MKKMALLCALLPCLGNAALLQFDLSTTGYDYSESRPPKWGTHLSGTLILDTTTESARYFSVSGGHDVPGILEPFSYTWSGNAPVLFSTLVAEDGVRYHNLLRALDFGFADLMPDYWLSDDSIPHPFYWLDYGWGEGNIRVSYPYDERYLHGSTNFRLKGEVQNIPPVRVPEPPTIALFGLALFGLGLRHRRKGS
ncbi:PEP-CTERM sorting domain-containing protein [Marinobacter daepoensis]|uniref:PEP-CTERM sorting domain-containing protein n=1 Tax=Marinobacter daepoensis TaxID=262077 RepID=A0ABS3BD89_9GAMM|nr:PEP-CTERM sorting domain-containing protein [Marinobacter daepoensis]MBN7768846.1 PEP-CTERM sorting domain-containing protein [Marinobacter daepoensis]MBY6077536.1 PEP-CTERM sorting domain-containing protein [Marinobacter daepoensis]